MYILYMSVHKYTSKIEEHMNQIDFHTTHQASNITQFHSTGMVL